MPNRRKNRGSPADGLLEAIQTEYHCDGGRQVDAQIGASCESIAVIFTTDGRPISTVKGKVLEEIVQWTLLNQGYQQLDSTDPNIDISASTVIGRGTSHQMDAFGQYREAVPFVYPIRLLGEAKCYDAKAVGVDIVREAIAVRKDLSENYDGRSDFDPSERRLDCVALFSTSGFSDSAQELAFAHNIYLVYMGHVRKHVDRIIDFYEPETHAEAEKHTLEYLSENEDTRFYFGNMMGTYPVTIVGNALPARAISQSDYFRLRARTKEESSSGAKRFRIMSREFEWSGVLELPHRLLSRGNTQRTLPDNSNAIIVPVMKDQMFRKVRIELFLEGTRTDLNG